MDVQFKRQNHRHMIYSRRPEVTDIFGIKSKKPPDLLRTGLNVPLVSILYLFSLFHLCICNQPYTILLHLTKQQKSIDIFSSPKPPARPFFTSCFTQYYIYHEKEASRRVDTYLTTLELNKHIHSYYI